MEVSGTKEKDNTAPDLMMTSGITGIGRNTTGCAVPGDIPVNSIQRPVYCTNRVLPGRNGNRIRFPALHFSGISTRIVTKKREYRIVRKEAYRKENS
jgi:hypothetical protein